MKLLHDDECYILPPRNCYDLTKGVYINEESRSVPA